MGSGAAALLVVCDFNAHGGTQTQVMELLEALDREAWAPRLATLNLDSGLGRKLDSLHVPVINLALRGALRPRTFAAVADLARHIRDNEVKLVHGLLLQGNFVAAAAAKSAGVPYLTSVRNLELWKTPVEILASRWVHHGAGSVVFNSRHVRDLVSRRETIPLSRTRVIYNGLSAAGSEASATSARAAALWPKGARPRLLCLASLFPKKGNRYLLGAFDLVRKSCPAAALVLAGQGPEREALGARVRALGLDGSVVFAGHREDARDLLTAADVLVLASIEEGMPNVLLEAMAAGVPQVATSVGGTPEAIDDGVTGFLVPPRDPVLMAQRIAHIALDATLREKMSLASRERFGRLFGRDRMAREHEALYRELIGGPG